MELLDFTLNENESYIYRSYYHSACGEREPTREEVILWRRVKELEAFIQNLRPPLVNEMLAAIPKGVDKVWVNIKSMELLQRYALDVIRLENTLPTGLHQEIWGSIRILVNYDGTEEPCTTWLACDRNLPDGVVSTERASTYLKPVSETLRSVVDHQPGAPG
jgi:hypothetical protein